MNELLFLFVAKIHWVIKEIITGVMSAHVQGIPLAPSFQAHGEGGGQQRKQGSDWLLQDPS